MATQNQPTIPASPDSLSQTTVTKETLRIESPGYECHHCGGAKVVESTACPHCQKTHESPCPYCADLDDVALSLQDLSDQVSSDLIEPPASERQQLRKHEVIRRQVEQAREEVESSPSFWFRGMPIEGFAGYIVGWAMPLPTTWDQTPNLRIQAGELVQVQFNPADVYGRRLSGPELDDLKERGMMAMCEWDYDVAPNPESRHYYLNLRYVVSTPPDSD